MISHTLNELADKARQIEDLLPASSPTYRRMYLQLEQDIELALERIATRMLKKFNMELPTQATSPEWPPDKDGNPWPTDMDKLVIGVTDDPSD